ncbi:MAG TPA: metallophosphoesterase [bacterium]
MKVLHTADLHLKEGEEDRQGILKDLVQKANEVKAGAFIIAGDLFESDKDAAILRSKVKSIFDQCRAPVIIIPGNHDPGSFGPDYDYGRNVIQAYKRPVTIFEIGPLKVAAIPYHEVDFTECVKDLPRNIDILVAHGTVYDQSFIFAFLDEEEEEGKTYMPMMPSNLAGICRYCALGHLHTRSIRVQYQNTHVAYPGSPVALSTKCDTERAVVLVDIDTDKSAVRVELLKLGHVPFWQHREFFIFPGYEQKVLTDLHDYMGGLDRSKIMPDIEIKGFISSGGREFNLTLEEINREMDSAFYRHKLQYGRIQSWDRVIEHGMVKRFVDKTRDLDDELRFKVFELVFPIFSDAIK